MTNNFEIINLVSDDINKNKKKILFSFQLKRSEKDTDGIYALSPHWYRDWENFVCEKSFGMILSISKKIKKKKTIV